MEETCICLSAKSKEPVVVKMLDRWDRGRLFDVRLGEARGPGMPVEGETPSTEVADQKIKRVQVSPCWHSGWGSSA